MITKAFEIRDRSTFIPVIAIKMVPTPGPFVDNDPERYLLRRSGYNFEDPCVVLCRMEAAGVARNATYDPYAWGGGTRTFLVAHEHIIRNFDTLENGAVVDVEFILGETTEPKKSERVS